MADRHGEDCMICRARALGMTEEQVELIIEALECGLMVGWTHRGIITRRPSPRRRHRMMLAVQVAWAVAFGTRVPESDEVAAHRHRQGGDR